MANIEQNVNLNFETNANEVKSEVDGLNKSLDKAGNSTNDLSQKTAGNTAAFKSNSNAVLENGGAMGLLNDLTGGYAMMVKDAVEASVLFTSKKKADVVVTNAQTVATTTQTSSTWLGVAAQEALNLVMSLNPYVLIATAVIAVGAGLVYFIKSSNDAADASAKLNSAIYLTTEGTKKYTEAVKTAKDAKNYDNDIEIMRAKQLGLSGKALDKYIEKLKAADLEEARIAASKAYRMFQESGVQVGQAIAGGDEDQIKSAKANQTALYDLYKTLNADFDTAILDGNRRREENRLKDYDKEQADLKTASDKKIAIQKSAQEKQLAIQKSNDEVVEKARVAAKVGVDEKAKELHALDELYKINFDDARLKEGKFSKELAIITEERLKEIARIEEKYRLLKTEADAKAKQEELDKAKGISDAKRIEVDKGFQQEMFKQSLSMKNEFLREEDAIELDRKIAKAQADILFEGKTAEEINKVKKSIDDKYDAQRSINKTHQYDSELDGAKMLLDSLTSINNDNLERQLAAAGDDEEKKDKIRRKAFENNKKLQLGLAIVTGIQAGLSAYAAGVAAFPGPGALAMGAVFAGISAVTTLASIAKIASSKYGGSSNGGSTGGSNAGAATATPSVAFQSSSDNQLASAVNKTQQNVIKTYVVASEVTTQQELDRKVTTSTSVG